MTGSPSLSTHINAYANSMFRHEALPEAWLEQCTAYIRHLFGDSLQGKTVLDYAFGRGNWSIALLRAGAKKVIAVDASEDNVTRFSAYCKAHGLDAIAVHCGNFLEAPMAHLQVDGVWAYGILHHLPNPGGFLDTLRPILTPNGFLYVYAYNAPSLRSVLVNAARNVQVFQSEADFEAIAPLLVRPARMRLRDDWVAPVVDFYTEAHLVTLLNTHGFTPTRPKDIDFQEFLTGKATWDFYPHQFLCTHSAVNPSIPEAPAPPQSPDLNHVEALMEASLQSTPEATQKQACLIGLMNTYYANLAHSELDTLRELVLYAGFHLIHRQAQGLSSSVTHWLTLLQAAAQDTPRTEFLTLLGDSPLVRYFVENRIRL